jgi:hypothetical protein
LSSKVIKFMYGLILLFVSISVISSEDISPNLLNNTTNKTVTDTDFSVNISDSLNNSAGTSSAINVTASGNITNNETTISMASEANETDNTTAIAAALNATEIITTAATFEIDNMTIENMTGDALTLENVTAEEIPLAFENVTVEEIPLALPLVSGASISIEVKKLIDFKKLAEFVDKQGYDVLEQDDAHAIWIFNGSTENVAFVYNDGTTIIASQDEFDLKTKEKLMDDLLRIMLNLRFSGNDIPDNEMGAALEATEFYTEEDGIYHVLRYDFNNDFDLTLSVPLSDIKEANLKILGEDCCQDALCLQKAQKYYIDGQLISECGSYLDKCCNVGVVDITDKIPSGDHIISAKSIDENKKHALIIEAVTSSKPPHMFLLKENERPAAYETTTSMNLSALEELINR